MDLYGSIVQLSPRGGFNRIRELLSGADLKPEVRAEVLSICLLGENGRLVGTRDYVEKEVDLSLECIGDADADPTRGTD